MRGTLPRIKPRILKNARALRKPMTPAEAKLWSRLRNRHVGFKFRRQHPIGNYIVDFCCTEIKLTIELDGESHVEQQEYDKKRTAWLIEQSYREIRFWNREVLQNLEGVLEQILVACQQTGKSPSP